MVKHTILLFVGLLCLPLLSKAQLQGQAKVDSLLGRLAKAPGNTNKVKLYQDISLSLADINPGDGIKYAEQGLSLANKLRWEPGVAELTYLKGANYQTKYEIDSALKYVTLATQLFKELNDKRGIAKCLGSAGPIYNAKGDLTMAANMLIQQQVILEEIGDQSLLFKCYSGLSLVYADSRSFAKALDYTQKALKIAEALHDKKENSSQLPVHWVHLLWYGRDEQGPGL